MANTFHRAIELFEIIGQLDPDTVWVEIGSDRGEGSTLALAGQAQRWGSMMHSVDISDHCSRIVSHPALVCHVAKGSVWTNHYASTVGKPISLLHLDNFDWIWDVYNIPKWIRAQINTYKTQHGIDMTNRQCQVEHLSQVLALESWLAPDCMIVMDDTYLHNGVWTGKCGAAAVYLEMKKFAVVHTDDGGTIMVRGFDMIYRIQ